MFLERTKKTNLIGEEDNAMIEKLIVIIINES